ncbi:nitrous oxide reductase accessory protein NosL [Achromobacter xylosoxidans]|uniref:nitrous oxide reductase accessory protein NosL n=1 Tax=Alcaligenes xylosoxydans xylosoxydans TaxID=85698 RepID=UPI0003D5974C|nr:nitrous oxide reductase accessory protein NosL [Achromobacter xylosoxidans]AHC48879.1 Nitrous oxide reductase maturation protein, outer-membrane lipoprotein NosL [Achromobacter xylosoxidans NBRC 15126 = ATCC 27061]KMJ92416.1 copper chaperone [Achromobacter xylosoxidans]QKQ53182.1 nitrous oxide reductase accessory protein NosL [Achromobacter xylosoxidans]QPR97673.1 nitrous oxide reductase accessory protein NosL [Achromobacter xylosoxidans]UON41614.1 nitrous oxide reductase accessory protein 
MRALLFSLGLAALLAVTACDDGAAPAAPPPPQAVSSQSVGHYCGMALADHTGPKGQIFIKGRPAPVWFSSIKQVFAYTLLPEEPKAIAAIYVNDMATAGADGVPDPAAWIDARQAFYVIEGRFVGGMGAEDAMPFSLRDRAEAFAQAHGGRVVAYADVPEAYVFAQ